MDPSQLPGEVRAAIDKYYATPIKVASNGKEHDIDLSSLRRVEAELLAALVYDLRPARSLEIGLAEGGSCIAITAARVARGLPAAHVVLDPYQETWADGVGLVELERVGLRGQVTWLAERSEDYLNAARTRDERFDFVFVDGGHDIGQKLTDAFYIAKVLNPGGVVAFHDGLMFSTSVAVRHLVQECGCEVVPLPADEGFKRFARGFRHVSRLGAWYAAKVMPTMCRSVVALRKPR